MNKIDLSLWKEFEISDLFITEKRGKVLQVPTGASIPKRFLEDGDIPRISATNVNNGILGYYKKTDCKECRTFNNFISVSFLGTVFYHDYLASLDMKIHCLQLKNISLNKYLAFYLISVIRKVISNTEYSDQISSTVLPSLKIKLPVDKNNNPDYKYMGNYIKQLEARERENTGNVSKYLEKLKPSKIDTKNWKRFNLYDENLFDIFSGTKLDKKNMTTNNPTVNFVGRTNLNNGISEKVDYLDGIEPYKKGDITLALGGSIGSCFIQQEPFYTSQNVNVLRAKKEMSFNCKLFICTMIFKEAQTYYVAFENELNRHIKKEFSILLPVDKNNNPDWQFMEDFITKTYKHAKDYFKQSSKLSKPHSQSFAC